MAPATRINEAAIIAAIREDRHLVVTKSECAGDLWSALNTGSQLKAKIKQQTGYDAIFFKDNTNQYTVRRKIKAGGRRRKA